MTSRVIHNGEGHTFPGGVKEIVFTCDQMDCANTVNDQQIQAGGGLKEMGWQATFVTDSMKHYCPDHNR